MNADEKTSQRWFRADPNADQQPNSGEAEFQDGLKSAQSGSTFSISQHGDRLSEMNFASLMPARRRFRFSLRALFAMLTIISISFAWLVSERSFVQERKSWAKNLIGKSRSETAVIRVSYCRESTNSRIPLVRRLFDDWQFDLIVLSRPTDQEFRSVSALFPEADIRVER